MFGEKLNLKMIPSPSGSVIFLVPVDRLWTSFQQIDLFPIVHRVG